MQELKELLDGFRSFLGCGLVVGCFVNCDSMLVAMTCLSWSVQIKGKFVSVCVILQIVQP